LVREPSFKIIRPLFAEKMELEQYPFIQRSIIADKMSNQRINYIISIIINELSLPPFIEKLEGGNRKMKPCNV